MTRAAVTTDECALSARAIFHPPSGRPPSASAAACAGRDQRREVARRSAATRRRRRPPSGNPARSATQRSAWFSAQIAPAPSIQPAAIVERRRPRSGRRGRRPWSGRRDERHRRRVVGRDRGRRQHLGPDAQGLLPADALGCDGLTRAPAQSSSPRPSPSSGCGLAMRFRAYATIARDNASVSSSYRCMSRPRRCYRGVATSSWQNSPNAST